MRVFTACFFGTCNFNAPLSPQEGFARYRRAVVGGSPPGSLRGSLLKEKWGHTKHLDQRLNVNGLHTASCFWGLFSFQGSSLGRSLISLYANTCSHHLGSMPKAYTYPTLGIVWALLTSPSPQPTQIPWPSSWRDRPQGQLSFQLEQPLRGWWDWGRTNCLLKAETNIRNTMDWNSFQEVVSKVHHQNCSRNISEKHFCFYFPFTPHINLNSTLNLYPPQWSWLDSQPLFIQNV